MAYSRSWHCGLLKHEDNDYDWSNCEADDLGKVPVTLFICFFGLVGNGTVFWFLGSHVCRNPITVYVLSLAVTNFIFLLSVIIALVVFYSSGSFCDRLVSQHVAAVLKISIVFTFTTSIYLLTAFSTVISLSILPCAHCHRSWRLPVLVCALLCVLSFLLTVSLYFIPRVLAVFILSYLFSVLMLTFSGLTLLARTLCCKRQHPPRELCVVVLLSIFFFPFFTADFGYWLLLRLLDFSAFAFNASLPLACANSSITPVLYFLAGSCASKFTLSVGDAFQRAFEGITETENGNETHRKNMVEVDV